MKRSTFFILLNQIPRKDAENLQKYLNEKTAACCKYF